MVHHIRTHSPNLGFARRAPRGILAFVAGCGGDASVGRKGNGDRLVDSAVNEVSKLIGEAVRSCETELLGDWQPELSQFVDTNWQDIQTALPSTTPVSLTGGTLIAYGTSRHEDFFQQYTLSYGDLFTIAVTDGVTFGSSKESFSFLVEEKLVPGEISSETYFTSRFECDVPKRSRLVLSVEAASLDEWALKVSVPSYPSKPEITINKLTGPGNTNATACLDGDCVEQELGDSFDEVTESMSGDAILLAGLQVLLAEGGDIESLIVSKQVFDVATVSESSP